MTFRFKCTNSLEGLSGMGCTLLMPKSNFSPMTLGIAFTTGSMRGGNMYEIYKTEKLKVFFCFL